MDREKVISALEEQITWIMDNDFHKFQGWGHAVLAMKDALALLKAQEPRVMTLEEVFVWAETPAEKRDPIFFEQRKGPNGWIANSACPKDYYLYCEDGDARCWTSRPTDEQREAVKWE